MKDDKDINPTGMLLIFGFPLLIIIAMCVVSMGGKEDNSAVG